MKVYMIVYSLHTQTHGSLNGLTVTDQVRSILVLLVKNIFTLHFANGTVVAQGQISPRRSHGPISERRTSTMQCTGPTMDLKSGRVTDGSVMVQRQHQDKEVVQSLNKITTEQAKLLHRKCGHGVKVLRMSTRRDNLYRTTQHLTFNIFCWSRLKTTYIKYIK